MGYRWLALQTLGLKSVLPNLVLRQALYSGDQERVP